MDIYFSLQEDLQVVRENLDPSSSYALLTNWYNGTSPLSVWSQ